MHQFKQKNPNKFKIVQKWWGLGLHLKANIVNRKKSQAPYKPSIIKYEIICKLKKNIS